MHRCFFNGRIFTGDAIVRDVAVEVKDGLVTALVPGYGIPETAEPVDLEGGLLAPGFIDVQVNGGGGVLFNDSPTPGAIRTIIDAHRRYGTTSLLPTLISDDWETMKRVAEGVRQGIAEGIPGLRGVHFEGPYLSSERKGIHQESLLRNVDEEAAWLLSSGDMGIVVTTVAPERVDNGYIRSLVAGGVKVCAGHSAATYEQVQTGLGAGITCFTHLFNAMSPFTSREPGVVGAALEDTNSWVGIIVDGHHIHYASLRVAVAAKRKGRVMLVTDAMPSVGAADKSFTLQGQRIMAEDGLCRSEQGTLAGSDLDMAGAVRNTVEHLRLPLEEALRMASLYPAEFLGLGDRLGRIEPGYEADFVALDDAFNVTNTWIGGNAG